MNDVDELDDPDLVPVLYDDKVYQVLQLANDIHMRRMLQSDAQYARLQKQQLNKIQKLKKYIMETKKCDDCLSTR